MLLHQACQKPVHPHHLLVESLVGQKALPGTCDLVHFPQVCLVVDAPDWCVAVVGGDIIEVVEGSASGWQ